MSFTRINDIDKYILADFLTTSELHNVSIVDIQSKKSFTDKLRWNRLNTYVNLLGISDSINRVEFISFGGSEYKIYNRSKDLWFKRIYDHGELRQVNSWEMGILKSISKRILLL